MDKIVTEKVFILSIDYNARRDIKENIATLNCVNHVMMIWGITLAQKKIKKFVCLVGQILKQNALRVSDHNGQKGFNHVLYDLVFYFNDFQSINFCTTSF